MLVCVDIKDKTFKSLVIMAITRKGLLLTDNKDEAWVVFSLISELDCSFSPKEGTLYGVFCPDGKKQGEWIRNLNAVYVVRFDQQYAFLTQFLQFLEELELPLRKRTGACL